VAKSFCPVFVNQKGIAAMQTHGDLEFLTRFVDLQNSRKHRGNNHLLIDMVRLVLCGHPKNLTALRGESWADIERFCKARQGWFEQFLELPFGIPSHDKLSRVLVFSTPHNCSPVCRCGSHICSSVWTAKP